MQSLKYEDNIGLVHFQAKRGFAWAMKTGTLLDYEDMFQEASMAFIAAADGYNPDCGVKFSAYYTRVAFSYFQKAVGIMTGVKSLSDKKRAKIQERQEENERRAAIALPRLPDINFNPPAIPFSELTVDMGAGGELDFVSFESTLMSDSLSPEEQLELREQAAYVMLDLSPLARLIIEWLTDPPEELLVELRAQAAHAEVCRSVGVRSRKGATDGVTIESISKFLKLVNEVPDEMLIPATAELNRAAKQFQEAA